MPAYEYRHRVCFEETNIVGNVYYAHYIRWQGRCREMFLHDHAPELMQELKHGVTLATTRVACAYYQELSVFDSVLIRMSSTAVTQSRLTMHFQYFLISAQGQERLVAEGEQEVACVRRTGDNVEPMPLPESLRQAVEDYITG